VGRRLPEPAWPQTFSVAFVAIAPDPQSAETLALFVDAMRPASEDAFKRATGHRASLVTDLSP
jgi:hypothetical protein